MSASTPNSTPVTTTIPVIRFHNIANENPGNNPITTTTARQQPSRPRQTSPHANRTHHLRTMRPGTAMAQGSQGSQTQTQTTTPTTSEREEHVVLRLRGAHDPATRRGIRWAEDVVDNEGLGRKSSKVCCIYHAPKAVGESSSEDDSDSSSNSDSDSEGSERGRGSGEARMVKSGADKTGKRRRKARGHEHEHHHEHGEDCGGDHGNEKTQAKSKRKPSPNAYEKIPKPRRPEHGGGSTVTITK